MAVFGTRPEAIKLAPVLQALRERRRDFRLTVCVTSQHSELLRPVLQLFDIRPELDLKIMRPNQNLASTTARILDRLTPLLAEFAPDVVLVQGDTTSTFAAALAAFYAQIPVAHVEAGLRSHDLGCPFPEELNRRTVSSIATIHFAPTRVARDNLIREGVSPKSIFMTGNPVVDALHAARSRSAELPTQLPGRRAEGRNRKLAVVTIHRRETFGQRLLDVCGAIAQVSRAHDEVDFIWPVHPNPEVKRTVYSHLRGVPGVHLVKPLDYLSFVSLLDRAAAVITDSGGIVEELAGSRVPVLVVRDCTERAEALRCANVELVGTDRKAIVAAVSRALKGRSPRASRNPYGNGRAAAKIVGVLETFGKNPIRLAHALPQGQ